MSHPIFIQNSRIGRVLFDIRGEYLEITAFGWDKKSELRLLLRSIDPNFLRKSQRLHYLFLIPLFLAIACVATIRIILNQQVFPHEIVLWPSFLFCGFLWATIRGIPLVEFYEFRNHWGKVAFHIIRERKQAQECDLFISDLTLRIQMAVNDIPPGEIAIPATYNPAIERHKQGCWKASIAFGSLAAGLPLVPGYDFTAVPFIILLCTGGLALGVFSFLAKEPRRWWSVIGMVLSLIPPYFY